MNANQEKIFSEMSESFKRAFGYSNIGFYKPSIPLYERAIQEDNNNFAAINNLAVAKIYLAIENRDTPSIKGAVEDLKKAIKITEEVYKNSDGYPIAQYNLNWAAKELAKLESYT